MWQRNYSNSRPLNYHSLGCIHSLQTLFSTPQIPNVIFRLYCMGFAATVAVAAAGILLIFLFFYLTHTKYRLLVIIIFQPILSHFEMPCQNNFTSNESNRKELNRANEWLSLCEQITTKCEPTCKNFDKWCEQ